MAEFYALKSAEVTEAEKRHAALARALARECPVLLENDGSLPIKNKGNLALYGNGARQTIKGGTGSGDVNTRTTVSIEEGLAAAGYTIVTKDWIDRNEKEYNDAKNAYLEWMTRTAKEQGVSEILINFSNPFVAPGASVIRPEELKTELADTAVYVISRNSGEGADRKCKDGDYLLFPEERENLAILGKSYRHVVAVLNVGGVMNVKEIKDIPGVGAILLMTQLGNIGGYVLGDILSGDVTPSGKLTDTWALNYEDYPSSAAFSHNDGDVDDEDYTEGIYVGYRYFDTFKKDVVYPFGYGKSYTEFSLQTDKVEQNGADLAVTVTVQNTGSVYAGKEVVQVYVSAPEGEIDKPYQELKGYKKTKLLAPGEKETLTVTIALAELASYSEKEAAWVLEKGTYVVRVGADSRNTAAAATLTLDAEVVTVKTRNLFAADKEFAELRSESCGGCCTKADASVQIAIDASRIPTQEVVYQGVRQEYHTDKTEKLTTADVAAGRCTLEELVAQLTVEELADYCVGTLRAEEGSIVGNASYTVPGAAGDSSSLLKEERGIKNMILADGPAGLRLQPHFKTTLDGKLLPGGEMIGDAVTPFGPDPAEGAVDYYQYCTAIPIGWALAQSWNTDILEQAGDMVGEEMEQFHVDLWLAPAMNIHRNPLCGRNFEYYSEDPLVSGRTAAAITNGVQRHPGKGTTIKHFAANSQEENRYFTNSHVSERAMREIYLKGFEITVKESQPLSIMTSYNLINGIHAANSHDLIQAAARDEWGFKGVVMTDWFTSQSVPMLTGGRNTRYPISASTGCVYAGNDMQMPGCRKNVEDLVKSAKENVEIDGFKVTKADLQFNAANVIRVAMETDR